MLANNPLTALLAISVQQPAAQANAGFTNLFTDAASEPPVPRASAPQVIAKADSHRVADALIRAMVSAGASRLPQSAARLAIENHDDEGTASTAMVALIKPPVVAEQERLPGVPKSHDDVSQDDFSSPDEVAEEEKAALGPPAQPCGQTAARTHVDLIGAASSPSNPATPEPLGSESQGRAIPSDSKTQITSSVLHEPSQPPRGAAIEMATVPPQASQIPGGEMTAAVAAAGSEPLVIVPRNTTPQEFSSPFTSSLRPQPAVDATAVDESEQPVRAPHKDTPPVAASAMQDRQLVNYQRGQNVLYRRVVLSPVRESPDSQLSVVRSSEQQLSEIASPAMKCDTPQRTPVQERTPNRRPTAQSSFTCLPQTPIFHSSNSRLFEPPRLEPPSSDAPMLLPDIVPPRQTGETLASKDSLAKHGKPGDENRHTAPVFGGADVVTTQRQTLAACFVESPGNADTRATAPLTTSTPSQPLPQPAADSSSDEASNPSESEAIVPFSQGTQAPVVFTARLVAAGPDISPVPPSTPKMAVEEANTPDRSSSSAAAFSNREVESAPGRGEAPAEKPRELRIRGDESPVGERQAGEIARAIATTIPDATVVSTKPGDAAVIDANEPHDVAQTLRTPEPPAAAPAPFSSAPAQEITVRIAPPNSMPVDLHVSQRGGEIHVSVRTPDAGLQTSLRQELGTLTSSLERAGYRAETFTPRDAIFPVAREMAVQTSANSRGNESQTPSGGRGGSGNPSNPRQQQQPRRQNPKNWLEELENSK